MKFIDTAKIYVKSGAGGAGHLSFRREKGVPKGGPDGGNGGKGGDVIFVADSHLSTLLDFRYKKKYIAEDGEGGGKSRSTGHTGLSVYIKVPTGTVIRDLNTNEILADLNHDKQEFIIAKGGDGGRGNAEFSTPTNQTPRYAEPGWPAVELEVSLELKLIADVGIVGFPNIGKSTLISVISAAKPKIANYPFTTLVPNLGIVSMGDYKSYTVADIPGLILGASEGKGLGTQFLRHVERTSLLLFLIDCMSADPVNDYKVLKDELKKYNPEMLQKRRLICFSRIDALTSEQLDDIKKIKFNDKNIEIMYVSSVANIGVDELKMKMWNMLGKDE